MLSILSSVIDFLCFSDTDAWVIKYDIDNIVDITSAGGLPEHPTSCSDYEIGSVLPQTQTHKEKMEKSIRN